MIMDIVLLLCFSVLIFNTVATEDAKASDVIYTLYTRTDYNGINITLDDIDVLNSTAFDGRFKFTFFMVFGLENPAGIDTYQIKDYLLATSDVNIFVVDWSKLAKTNRELEEMVVTLGGYMTEFILTIAKTYRIFFIKTNFIAFSLAAHAAGVVSSNLNNLINTIEALDPAIVVPENPTKYLNETVTHYLKVTHTNGGQYGYNVSFGHIDYYPNGGSKQPGCNSNMCSHERVLAYYAESLLSDKFIAKKCTDYESYSNGLCDDGETSSMGGAFQRTRTYGVYFLDTNGEPPYAKG